MLESVRFILRSFIETISVLLLFAILPSSAHADLASDKQAVEAQSEDVARIAVQLAGIPDNLIDIRQELIAEREEAGALQDRILPQVEALEAALKRLGEPTEGESILIRSERTSLKSALAVAQDTLESSNQSLEEINRLISVIAELRRERFYKDIVSRRAPLFSGDELSSAAGTFNSGVSVALTSGQNWFEAQRSEQRFIGNVALLALAFAVALFLIVLVRRWISGVVEGQIKNRGTDAPSALSFAALSWLARLAPTLIGGSILFEALDVIGLISATTSGFARSVWLGFVLVVAVDAAHTVLLRQTPTSPALFNRSEQPADLASRLLFFTAAFILALDGALTAGSSVFGQSQALASVQAGLISLLLAGALYLLAGQKGWLSGAAHQIHRPGQRFWPKGFRYFRLSLKGLSFASALFALSGYTFLPHFLTTRAAWILIILVGALWVRGVLRESLTAGEQVARSRRETEKEDDPLLIMFWIRLLIDFLIIAVTIPIILILFGSDWSDVLNVAIAGLSGFEIGNTRISFGQVGLALLVFAGLLTLTRLVQRTVDKTLLPNIRMDVGVRNSLTTLVGYVGLVIAFVTGVGLMGFDLSNLAIIAGALSVGIGFGLQSIVNNFVSGLILLFERPIKVGDWVVTSSGEGIVKRISVRSTEIETFDRSSIIVPNSELISNSVTNWTHKNKLGRISIAVGVSYDEDPDHILELLQAVPDKVDLVLSDPPPLILFTGFGDSSLDFEIRGFLADISTSLRAKSQLRAAIFKTFKEAGVDIPFPQRDLHIRSVSEDAASAWGKSSEKNTD